MVNESLLNETGGFYAVQGTSRLQSLPPEYFRQLVDAIPQIVWIVDDDGKTSYFNRRWFDFTGYNPLNWNASEDCPAAVHPEDRSIVTELMVQALQGIETFDIEYRLKRKDGVYRWHLGRLVPIRDHFGRILHYFGTATDIEDHVTARQKVEESDEHLRLALAAAQMGTYEWSIADNKIICSKQTERLYGLEPGEFKGTLEHGKELLHPEDWVKITKLIEEGMITTEDFRYEFRVIWPKDKSIHWLSAYGRVTAHTDGKAIRLIGTVVDITEQKKSELALKASEEKFRALNDLAPVGIFETDVYGNCITVNPSWSRLTGLSLEKASAQGWLDALHPEDKERLSKEWYEAACSGRDFKSEYRFRTPHGEVTWVSGSAVAWRDTFGQIRGYIGTVTDITRIRQTEEALRGQQKWLEAAFNSVPIPLNFMEPGTGKILFANKAANAMAGGETAKNVTASEYPILYRITDDHDNLIPNEDTLGAKLARREAVKGETMVWHTPAGRFNLLVAGELLPAMYGHPETIVSTFQDISQLKAIERELQEAVKARDELMSICGHEFKTPLSALRLQTQTAMKRISRADHSIYEPVKIQKLIQNYGSQIERLIRLVDDMLDVSRLNSGKFHLKLERANLGNLTFEVIERFRDQFEASGCQVNASLMPNVFINCDPFRIEQVLINLLTNAMKYGKARPISVTVTYEKSSVLLSVQDQGIGIAKENHRRIFKRFERAISATEVSGLGLGLYIVKAIVDAHRGTISVQSELGQGAKFTLKLPHSQNDHG